MKSKKRTWTKIAGLLLCICMLAGLTGNYAQAAPMVGKNNTSESIYKWSLVEDYDSLWNVVKKKNHSYRLLLLCGEAYSKSSPPKIEEYAVFDRSDENHAFSYVDVKEAEQIAYKDDEFYTRGSLQTPIVEFTGETHTDDRVGNNAPICKIYVPDSSEKKTDVMLCSVDDTFTTAQSKLWTPQTYRENKEDWPDKSDEWIFFFPAQSYPKGFTTNGSGYNNGVKGYVGLATDMCGDGDSLCLVDWDEDDGTTKYLESMSLTRWMSYDDSNEMLYKCYIGEELDNTSNGSFTVYDGQSRSLTDITYIEEGATIRVEKGGTLFISGTCFNNGVIINDGGTVILQKGALMTQSDSVYSSAGMINLKGGTFVVRNGARLILDEQVNSGRSDITLSGDASLINGGIMALANNIKITSADARLRNDETGVIYCGYDMKAALDVCPGYQASKSELSVTEYVNNSNKECLSRLEKKRQGYIYNDGGTIINAGTCDAEGY